MDDAIGSLNVNYALTPSKFECSYLRIARDKLWVPLQSLEKGGANLRSSIIYKPTSRDWWAKFPSYNSGKSSCPQAPSLATKHKCTEIGYKVMLRYY